MRELINTIAHIGYQVSDLTRSLAFYEPLGFQRQQRFSKPSPQGTIEVAFLEMAGAVLSRGLRRRGERRRRVCGVSGVRWRALYQW